MKFSLSHNIKVISVQIILLILISVAFYFWKGNAKAYNMWLGVGAGVVGILGFVPVINDVLLSIFGINAAISVLHIIIAIVSLGVVYGLKK